MRGTAASITAASVMLIAAAEPGPAEETVHIVKPGETLSGIANRANVPRVLIIEANALMSPFAVRTGQELIIPRRRSHVVSDGETGFAIALDQGVPWSVIAAANAIDPAAPLRTGQMLVIPTLSKQTFSTPTVSLPATAKPSNAVVLPVATGKAPTFLWPVSGKIRRGFASQKGSAPYHDGIDILAAKGTAVRAAAAGKVIFAAPGPREYGQTVILFHGARWTTTYSYLDAITVKDGEMVKAGERIGLVGQTGLAAAPQLHFEVRRSRAPLNPATFLPAPIIRAAETPRP